MERAVTLLHRKGYFYQHLDEHGGQYEEPVAWQYVVRGVSGFTVPVYFLDADLPDNTPWGPYSRRGSMSG